LSLIIKRFQYINKEWVIVVNALHTEKKGRKKSALLTFRRKKPSNERGKNMNTLDNHNIRLASLQQLKAINKNSIQLGYNRNIPFTDYCSVLKADCIATKQSVWHGLKTVILLEPLMVHTHKATVPCEPHIRAQIWDLEQRMLFVDVAMSDWTKLPILDDEAEAA
jgi:hypothetical protein